MIDAQQEQSFFIGLQTSRRSFIFLLHFGGNKGRGLVIRGFSECDGYLCDSILLNIIRINLKGSLRDNERGISTPPQSKRPIKLSHFSAIHPHLSLIRPCHLIYFLPTIHPKTSKLDLFHRFLSSSVQQIFQFLHVNPHSELPFR